MDAVADEARKRGDHWVRLRCWSTNARLHAYCEAHGPEHVRTDGACGRMSGALFQRPMSRMLPGDLQQLRRVGR